MYELEPDAVAVREFGNRKEQIQFIVSELPIELQDYRHSYQAVGKAVSRYGFDITYTAAQHINEKVEVDFFLIRLMHLCKTVHEVRKVSRTEEAEKSSVAAIKTRSKSADIRKQMAKAQADPEEYVLKLLLEGRITKDQRDAVSGDTTAALELISATLLEEE